MGRLGLATLFSLMLMALCVLGVRADPTTPPGRYVVTSSTVRDTATGLTWQRRLSPWVGTYAQVATFCSTVTTEGGGWRSPTIKELQTIVDERRVNPAVDPDAFPDTPADFSWSATPYVPLGGQRGAWCVNFLNGRAEDCEASDVLYVRCVR